MEMLIPVLAKAGFEELSDEEKIAVRLRYGQDLVQWYVECFRESGISAIKEEGKQILL